MFFRILKRDLKRKKSTNIILLAFILLASMFVAAGLNNVVTVINGTGYYLDLAGVGDYNIITMREGDESLVEDILEREPAVKDFRIDEVIWGDKTNLKSMTGESLDSKNATLYQQLSKSSLSFFDENNSKITHVEPGYTYATSDFFTRNNLKTGDRITIEHNGTSVELILAGHAKDALLGSQFMGNTRFLMNEQDYDKFLVNEKINSYYRGSLCYVDTDAADDVAAAVSDCSNVVFAGTRSMIESCYVMDMIVAFIMLVLGLCLIIVSFVVLRFSIVFTLNEEFREIGVMKAIGIRNLKIRSLYVSKYLLLAVLGAALGFAASIPFGNMLLDSVTSNMVLGNSGGLVFNLIGSFAVVILIVMFAFLSTGKVKKSSPLDAIREGSSGERFGKKRGMRISEHRFSNPAFLALNDVFSAPRRFLTIIITFFLCTLFVLLLVNTTETMDSDSLVGTFVARSDIYFTDVNDSMKSMNGVTKEEFTEHLKEFSDKFTAAGMPSKVVVETQYKLKAEAKGKVYSLTFQQGVGTTADMYEYTDGIIPKAANEIAVTEQIAKLIDVKLGDTVKVGFGREEVECVVVAYFQSMNQLGEIIRLHPDADVDFEYLSGFMSYQVNFTDDPSKEEIEARKAKIKEIVGVDEVMDAREFCIDNMGVLDTMRAVQFLLLGITLIVVLLVTILMERTFIANERSQIAILKAIGFKDRRIVRWHVYRFGIVALIAVLFAAALSIPATELIITPIFGMMGATEVAYVISPLKIFVIYPGIIFLMTIVISYFTALGTKRVKSSDTANIE